MINNAMRESNAMVSKLGNELWKYLLRKMNEVNGTTTEEELNMEIIKEVIKKREVDEMVGDNTFASAGVYVMYANEEGLFGFECYRNIKDAIKKAVSEVDATIFYCGEEVEYSMLNDKLAYYIDKHTGKTMGVEVG